jgi:hypothetical protein
MLFGIWVGTMVGFTQAGENRFYGIGDVATITTPLFSGAIGRLPARLQ